MHISVVVQIKFSSNDKQCVVRRSKNKVKDDLNMKMNIEYGEALHGSAEHSRHPTQKMTFDLTSAS